MQVFYVPETDGAVCTLDENESRHCVRSLRMTKGDIINIIDGKGGFFEGTIDVPDPKACRIIINRVKKDFEKRDYRLHIAISPLKNSDRFEWFIEKSVEIGIDEITPLLCRNTEKPGIKADRINSIIISAMKQSLKAYKPVLNEPVIFVDFIRSQPDEVKMIAHCNSSMERKGVNQICNKGKDVLILIGPEGDFSEDEIISAVENGFNPVHLGKSRLRTETAGIAACHTVYFINS